MPTLWAGRGADASEMGVRFLIAAGGLEMAGGVTGSTESIVLLRTSGAPFGVRRFIAAFRGQKQRPLGSTLALAATGQKSGDKSPHSKNAAGPDTNSMPGGRLKSGRPSVHQRRTRT